MTNQEARMAFRAGCEIEWKNPMGARPLFYKRCTELHLWMDDKGEEHLSMTLMDKSGRGFIQVKAEEAFFVTDEISLSLGTGTQKEKELRRPWYKVTGRTGEKYQITEYLGRLPVAVYSGFYKEGENLFSLYPSHRMASGTSFIKKYVSGKDIER